ncbi:hypothetical protein P43SY_010129 [Pythium insidiosum]|uniref:Cyclic nucleotide-binding domain-containing protein n=1 Tax=Pythium insidiosum TaxID=114742 RepID=A0AAD5LDQ2_PYTIN|nr:hypothetical protein P43SY_010129 [Pythium insidiosum]
MNEVLLRSVSPVTVVAATLTEVSRIEAQTFLMAINDSRFADKASAIRDSAAQEAERQQRSRAAIVRNLMTKKRLQKDARGLSTLFPEDNNLSHQPHKAPFRFYWDWLILCLNVYNVFQITYRISFASAPSHTMRSIVVAVDLLGDLCLGVDIWLKMYYFECDGGLMNIFSRRVRDEISLPGESEAFDRSVDDLSAYVYVLDVSCILDVALKWSVFRGIENASRSLTSISLDVFAAIPFDVVLFFPQLIPCGSCKWNYLGLLQLNKAIRIYQAKALSERVVQSISFDFNLAIHDTSLRFLRSLGIFILFGHWIACGWYRASLYASLSSATSWFVTPSMLTVQAVSSLRDVPYLRRYLRCAHFAAGSITTVFYGDITSTNTVETLVELTVGLLSILVFGALVGAHRERLEALYKRRMQFEQQLMELQTFLANHKVSATTQARIRTYYVNAWLHNGGEDDHRGTRALSRLLVEDAAQFALQRVAAQVSVFRACDDCFLRALLASLRHIICAPADVVVSEGDVARSMYFIDRGKILVQGRGFELVKGEGDFFGELSLLYGIPRSATCSCMGMALLYVLEGAAYDRILRDFPEYKLVTRRDWVLVSTVLTAAVEPRFRELVGIVARMEHAPWMELDAIIRKARQLT